MQISAANLANNDGRRLIAAKSITFTGGAGAGAVGTVPLFTVTGDVLLRNFLAVCGTTLVGATATISAGTAAAVAALLPVTTGTLITAGLIWDDATPTVGIKPLVALNRDNVIANTNLVLNILVAALTAGVLKVYAEYTPLSADGLVA